MRQLATALFLLSAAAPALAQDEIVGLRLREWYARMSGTIEAEDKNLGSTRLDLSDDLGLGDQNLTTELQVYLRIPVLGRIYAGWWHASDSGSETLSQDIIFAGEKFTASTQIDSDFKLDVAYLMYEFAFPTIPIGDLLKLELGVSAGVRAFRGEGSIQGGGLSASDNGTAGLPTLGAHVTARLFDLVRVETEVVGLVFKYSNNEVHYLEAFAEASIEPLPWLFAGVGYKIAQLNFLHDATDRVHINIDIAGVYITVGVRF